MTEEQKNQLNELLKMQRAEERRERDRMRRAAERYVTQRFGLTISELDKIVADYNNNPQDKPINYIWPSESEQPLSTVI